MNITIELRDETLTDIVHNVVTKQVEHEVVEYIIGDRMAFFWEVVNEKVDEYLRSERFGKLLRDTIRSSEDKLAEAIIQSMVGNDR